MHNIRTYIFLMILVAGNNSKSVAQTLPDSVIQQYKSAKTDADKLYPLFIYTDKFREDTSFFRKAALVIQFLKSMNDTRSEDFIQLSINDQLAKTGDYVNALSSALEIGNRFEKLKDKKGILAAYRNLSSIYYYTGDKEKDIIYGKKALLIAKEFNSPEVLSSITNNLSTAYSQKNIADSALLYARQSLGYAKQSTDSSALGGVLGTMAEAFIAYKQYDSALIYARFSKETIANDASYGNLGLVWTLNDLSQIFFETNHYDSSRHYAHMAIQISMALGYKDQIQRGYEYLSRAFSQTHHYDSAFRYLQLAVILKDSLYNDDKTKQVQGIVAREQLRLQEIEKEKLSFENKIKLYSLIGGLLILGIIIFLLYRNNRQKQKANSTLQMQKEKVETTLQELEQTQQQLIQSEKMASLGELTAGIAHEIQNPLNFVNNFSEVNKELSEELRNELATGNWQQASELAADIKDNSDKINHHGKRADAIVKGMLQHSRSSSGQKEPTDINALSDEYLRLAYHGLRGKDSSFNATIKTDLDETIGTVNVIPQDIGRVLLNLFNNAFYAVHEKKARQPAGYEPAVSLRTKKMNGLVEIKVTDNGGGIPANIVDKIFQPFFTTKPTGQGTGLGLSLAYDILKAHGGELKVETKQGEGSEFIIQLPI